MKDINGIEICVGDKVVTPSRRSSSQWLTVREVVEVSENGCILKGPRNRNPFGGGSGSIAVVRKSDSVVQPSTDGTGIHSMVEGNRSDYQQ